LGSDGTGARGMGPDRRQRKKKSKRGLGREEDFVHTLLNSGTQGGWYQKLRRLCKKGGSRPRKRRRSNFVLMEVLGRGGERSEKLRNRGEIAIIK